MHKTVLLAATLAGFSAGGAYAAEAIAPDTAKTAPAATSTVTASATAIVTTMPGDRLSSKIVGADVHARTGEKIGDVADLVVDVSGRVTGIVVGVGGFLGVGEKVVALPYDAVTMATDVEGRPYLSVDVTKETLEKAPRFEPAKG